MSGMLPFLSQHPPSDVYSALISRSVCPTSERDAVLADSSLQTRNGKVYAYHLVSVALASLMGLRENEQTLLEDAYERGEEPDDEPNMQDVVEDKPGSGPDVDSIPPHPSVKRTRDDGAFGRVRTGQSLTLFRQTNLVPRKTAERTSLRWIRSLHRQDLSIVTVRSIVS